MADNILLNLVVDDKGRLKVISKDSKAAAKGMESVAKSSSTADRNMKGASRQSANSTKNFSKMAQGMTGTLVPAYATLAANIFAITAAFSFFKNAADLRVIEQSQVSYAKNTGLSLRLLTKDIQNATDGVLSFKEAASGVAIGAAAGLDAGQLKGLAEVAKDASLALGRDLTDSFNRLIRGATKAEPELLDELGIILRLEKATRTYSQAVNKNVKDLTAWERTQAVVNEILTQGAQKFGDIGGEVNQFNKLGKSFNDLLKDIMDQITPFAEFIAGSLANNVLLLSGAFLLLGKNITQSLIPAAPALEGVDKAAEKAHKRLSKVAGTGVTAEALKNTDVPFYGSRDSKGRENGEANLKRLEAAVKRTSTNIVKITKENRAQIQRDVKILRAEYNTLHAENTSGVKRSFAIWKAELYSLQAVHGTVMGAMKAAALSFTRFMNTALAGLGWLGLLLTLGSLAKELVSKILPQGTVKFKNWSDRAKDTVDRLEEQRAEVEKLSASFSEAADYATEISRQAGLLSNLDFSNFSDFLLDANEANIALINLNAGALNTATAIGGAFASLINPAQLLTNVINGITAELVSDENPGKALLDSLTKDIRLVGKAWQDSTTKDQYFEALGKSVVGGLTTLQNLQTALKETGLPNSKAAAFIEDFSNKIVRAQQAIDNIKNNQIVTPQDLEAIKAYNSALSKTPYIASDIKAPIMEANAALKDLLAVQEQHEKMLFRKKGADSYFDQYLTNLNSVAEDINRIQIGKIGITGSTTLSQIGEQYQEAISSITSVGLTGDTTIEKALEIIEEKIKTIRATSLDILKNSGKLKVAKEVNTRGATSLQRAEAEEVYKIEEKKLEIQKASMQLQHDIKDLEIKGDTEAIIAKQAQLELLKAQLGTYERMVSVATKLEDATKQAFSTGLSSGLNDLITGKESSFKDAVADLATKTLEGAAKAVSDQLTLLITNSLFGSPAKKIKNAMTEAADYHAKKIKEATCTDAGTGTGTGTGTDTPTDAGKFPSVKDAGGLWNWLFGRETRTTQQNKVSDIYGNDMWVEGATRGEGHKGIFRPFLDSLGDLFDSNTEGGFVGKLGEVFKTGASGFGDLFKSIMGLFTGGGGDGIASLISTGIGMLGFGTARYGGVLNGYATGGVARGSDAGHLAMLHGTEAVVPLPNNRSIPVELNGAGSQQNNVSVNVNIANDGSTSTETQGGQGMNLGNAIARAVQQELQNQKRSGGILNPYGAA